LSSERLPGKALLYVETLPAIVLAAKRAGNTGLPVCVALSEEAFDDSLEQILKTHNIMVKRGALNNLLERYYIASKDLSDDAIIVRLTGDNLFPDGAFIEKSLQIFLEKKAAFGRTIGVKDKVLPYGVIAEIFTVKALREVFEVRQEKKFTHVTSHMKEAGFEVENLPLDIPNDWDNLNASLDTFEDYQRVLRVFHGSDPVNISWQDLCQKLNTLERRQLEER